MPGISPEVPVDLLQRRRGGIHRHVPQADQTAYLAYLVGILKRRAESAVEMKLFATVAHVLLHNKNPPGVRGDRVFRELNYLSSAKYLIVLTI